MKDICMKCIIVACVCLVGIAKPEVTDIGANEAATVQETVSEVEVTTQEMTSQETTVEEITSQTEETTTSEQTQVVTTTQKQTQVVTTKAPVKETTTKVKKKKKIKIVVTDPKVKETYTKDKPSLTWKKYKNNTGYEVRVSKKKSGKYKTIYSTKKNVFYLKKLDQGRLYYIQVVAYKKYQKNIYYSKKKIKPLQVMTNVKLKTPSSYFAGTATAKWETSSKASGYSIEYSTSKKFKDATRIKIKSKSIDRINLYDLKQGKTYYIRIRAYKTEGKDNIYSLWSEEKSFKVADASSVTAAGYRATEGYFSNSVFIGDSVLQGFQIYVKNRGTGYLDGTKVAGVVSYSLTAAIQSSSKYHPLYKGKHIPPQQYVRAIGAKKVFLSFGINDLHGSSDVTGVYNKYMKLISNIRGSNPGVKIHILSTTPPMKGSENYVNYAKNIRALNMKMRAYCDATDAEYIDTASYISTSEGYLRSDLCSDKFVHQTMEAYSIWDKVLRTYAWNYNH